MGPHLEFYALDFGTFGTSGPAQRREFAAARGGAATASTSLLLAAM
jgi:hypothetical protein